MTRTRQIVTKLEFSTRQPSCHLTVYLELTKNGKIHTFSSPLPQNEMCSDNNVQLVSSPNSNICVIILWPLFVLHYIWPRFFCFGPCRVTVAELNKNPPEGVSVGLSDDDNMFMWELLIVGPPDTVSKVSPTQVARTVCAGHFQLGVLCCSVMYSATYTYIYIYILQVKTIRWI